MPITLKLMDSVASFLLDHSRRCSRRTWFLQSVGEVPILQNWWTWYCSAINFLEDTSWQIRRRSCMFAVVAGVSMTELPKNAVCSARLKNATLAARSTRSHWKPRLAKSWSAVSKALPRTFLTSPGALKLTELAAVNSWGSYKTNDIKKPASAGFLISFYY